MSDNKVATIHLGDVIYADIDSNEYLREIGIQKPEQSAARFPGADSGCPPFSIIFLVIVRFVRRWPKKGG